MTARDYPKIIVPPPGPKARAIVDRDAEWTSTCYIQEYPLVVSRGQGVMVEDVDGNRYLDFMAGIAVSSTGYGHPKVVAAVKDAADRFLHRVPGPRMWWLATPSGPPPATSRNIHWSSPGAAA